MTKRITIRSKRKSAGFALLVTLVVLVVLTALTAGLATRLTMAKRRQQYMIGYQQARYGLDSGLKFILAEMPKASYRCESREGMPDFSDLFWMDDTAYSQMIADWAAEATEEQIEAVLKEGASLYESEPVDMGSLMGDISSLFGGGEAEPNDMIAETSGYDESVDEDTYYMELDPNDIEVPGPYGVPWPYVSEPIEFEVGDCEVTITIEDENAKLPLSWLVRKYADNDTSSHLYAMQTFLEWMADDTEELKALEDAMKEQMETIYGKKKFTMNAGDILAKSPRSTSKTQYRTVRKRDPKTGKIVTKRVPITSKSKSKSKSKTTSQKRPAIAHRTDFAKLFHSSLLDQDRLNVSRMNRGIGDEEETVLKYIGLWGSQRVNVNTAPRHILEATFALEMTASEAVEVAQAVIVKRQGSPLKKIDEIKELGLLDTDTFNKLKRYITTTSTFFKIRVTSDCGNASASAVAAVVKETKQSQTLVVLYDK